MFRICEFPYWGVDEARFKLYNLLLCRYSLFKGLRLLCCNMVNVQKQMFFSYMLQRFFPEVKTDSWQLEEFT